MAKATVTFDAKTGDYRILTTNRKGEETVRDTIHVIPRMDDLESVKVFQGLVKDEPNARRASVSLLCNILVKSPKDIDEWHGAGDKTKGQLSDGLKEAFRKMEDTYFGQFMKADHPAHKTFVTGLPKVNDRGEKLEAEGKEQVGERFAYFVTRTRKSPSYANAKNLFLRFWAFTGEQPMDKDGNIVPPEVMRAKIDAALELPEPDNTYGARLLPMLRELVMPADPEKPVYIKDDHLPELVSFMERALDEIRERANKAAATATRRVKAGDSVQTKADQAIANAERDKKAANGNKPEPQGTGKIAKAEAKSE